MFVCAGAALWPVAGTDLTQNQFPFVCMIINSFVRIGLCCIWKLCLNIVGNLIRTYGSGWEEEIPSILKKDMKSLSLGEEAIEHHQPLNLQQRVIQSGLDSMEGADSAGIVLLFKGMAVFAEDQVVPVAILSVLWVSIDPKEHKPLSGMKVRQWVSQLLSRSILLGSSADGQFRHIWFILSHKYIRNVHTGVSMHDIVRVRRMDSFCSLFLIASHFSFRRISR